jgi:hypothetical protein
MNQKNIYSKNPSQSGYACNKGVNFLRYAQTTKIYKVIFSFEKKHPKQNQQQKATYNSPQWTSQQPTPVAGKTHIRPNGNIAVQTKLKILKQM